MIRILTLAAILAVFTFSLAASGQEPAKKFKKGKAKDDITKKDKAKADLPLDALAEKRAKAIKAFDGFARGDVAAGISKARAALADPDLDRYDRTRLIALHNKLVAAYNSVLPELSSNAQAAADAYNRQGVADHNRLVEKYNREVAEYNRVLEKYNKAISK